MIKLPSNFYKISKTIFILAISFILIFIFNSVWRFISNIDDLSYSHDSSIIKSEFSYYIDHSNNFDIKTLFNKKSEDTLKKCVPQIRVTP